MVAIQDFVIQQVAYNQKRNKMELRKIIGAIAIIGFGILAYNQYKKYKAEKSKITITAK